MKERPILFSTSMVQAILNGSKTQTRRVMRRQPDAVERFKRGEEASDTDAKYAILRCYKNPKGFKKCASGWSADAKYKTPFHEFNVGDQLWVRETWHVEPGVTGWSMDDNEPCIGWIEYKAGGSKEVVAPNFDAVQRCFPKGDVDWDFLPYDWRPSIFMPRWACRLILEITKIRVERLNDISEADAIAEGMIADDDYCAEEHFSMLWNEINGWGEKGWNANPWVWVIEFKVIQGETHE